MAQDNLKQIKEAVAEYTAQNSFSGTILVAEKGQPIFHQSYGLAYRATPDTLQNNYHYSIASITKVFTAIRILQLVEQGNLDLQTPIISYFPEWSSRISDQVTIHHLLLHISGLPNEKDKLYQHELTPEKLVELTLQHKSKSLRETFNYNNLDYVLLGLLIESVTGNTWQGEISANILQPLEMEATGFLEYGYYPDNFAYTYSYGNGKKPKQDPLFYIENFYAAGCMYSTTLDLLKLDQALYNNRLLNKASRALLAKSYPEYNYVGYGVWNYQYPFTASRPTIMERRGGILGANVVLVRLTDSNKTIIILSNTDQFNPDSFGDPQNLREALIRALETNRNK